MANETFKHRCDGCSVREACQHTFARFWMGKSHGGVGCERPTGDERWSAEVLRVVAEDAARRKDEDEAARIKVQSQPQRRETAKAAPRELWHKYAVIHRGKRYETTANSEAGAVNCIRYKLYGLTPLDQCPPFSAERADDSLPSKGTKPTTVITRDDVRRRLARMAK